MEKLSIKTVVELLLSSNKLRVKVDLHFTRDYWVGSHLVWINFVLKNPTDCYKRNLKIAWVSYCPFGLFVVFLSTITGKESIHPFKTPKPTLRWVFPFYYKMFLQCADVGGGRG